MYMYMLVHVQFLISLEGSVAAAWRRWCFVLLYLRQKNKWTIWAHHSACDGGIIMLTLQINYALMVCYMKLWLMCKGTAVICVWYLMGYNGVLSCESTSLILTVTSVHMTAIKFAELYVAIIQCKFSCIMAV